MLTLPATLDEADEVRRIGEVVPESESDLVARFCADEDDVAVWTNAARSRRYAARVFGELYESSHAVAIESM
jgi:hypothetical protein